jgi:hypothetical protein
MKKLILLLLINLIGAHITLQAQSDSAIKILTKIAKKEFPKAPAENIKYGIENGTVYYIMNDQHPYYQNIYLNHKFERLYAHISMQSPNFSDFQKYYVNKTCLANIQKYLRKYKKSVLKGPWFAAYYKNINNSELISIREFEDHGKGDWSNDKSNLGELFFDKNGKFIAKGDFDVLKYLGVHIDKSIRLDNTEGNLFAINTEYYIRNVKYNLYMDVLGNSKENMGRIVLYNLTSTSNQKFEILSVDATGKYKIQNINSMKMLSGLAESTNIIQYDSDEGERQIFEIEKVEGNKHGLVRLRMAYNGKYLGVENKEPKKGANIYEHDANPLDESLMWELILVEN